MLTLFGQARKEILKSVLAAKLNETHDETSHSALWLPDCPRQHRRVFKDGALKKCISVVLFAVQMMFCVTA